MMNSNDMQRQIEATKVEILEITSPTFPFYMSGKCILDLPAFNMSNRLLTEGTQD